LIAAIKLLLYDFVHKLDRRVQYGLIKTIRVSSSCRFIAATLALRPVWLGDTGYAIGPPLPMGSEIMRFRISQIAG
jgi:hypothetical protein